MLLHSVAVQLLLLLCLLFYFSILGTVISLIQINKCNQSHKTLLFGYVYCNEEGYKNLWNKVVSSFSILNWLCNSSG